MVVSFAVFVTRQLEPDLDLWVEGGAVRPRKVFAGLKGKLVGRTRFEDVF